MPTTLLIRSLSFVSFGFECAAIDFDVSRFLAIIVGSVIPGLAPASLICRWSGRTSSSVVRWVQPVGSPDIVLIGFEPESIRFQICVLLNLLEVTPVT